MKRELPPPILTPPRTKKQAVADLRALLVWWIQHGMHEDLACYVMKQLDAFPVKDARKSTRA